MKANVMYVLAAAWSIGLFACGGSQQGATPPTELADARSAYAQLQSGPAAKYFPQELAEVEGLLQKAEKSYTEDGESKETRAAALAASRAASQLDSRARATEAQQLQRMEEVEKQSQELAQQQAAARQQEQAAQAQAVTEGMQQLYTRLTQAAGSRAEVTKENRGIVVTFPSKSMFRSGESLLLPSGQTLLTGLSNYLKGSELDVVVEAHSDAQQQEKFKEELSLSQAQAVRNYLVKQGLPTERARAVGLGAARPLGDNATKAGREKNQRVEIVINPIKPAK
jgi:flagellar motor protein MotB